MNIVIVDDEVSSGILCKEAIFEKNKDCAITLLTNGQELKDHLNHNVNLLNQADLILLDLHLHPQSGKEILAEIKAHPTFRRIPVVILTGSKNNQDVIDCLDLHANCFVTKDHDFAAFSERIGSLIHCWRNVATFPIKEVYSIAPARNRAGDALENESGVI